MTSPEMERIAKLEKQLEVTVKQLDAVTNAFVGFFSIFTRNRDMLTVFRDVPIELRVEALTKMADSFVQG